MKGVDAMNILEPLHMTKIYNNLHHEVSLVDLTELPVSLRLQEINHINSSNGKLRLVINHGNQ